MQETQGVLAQSLGQEDPLEEEMATHSNILAWEIPGRGGQRSLGGLESMGVAESRTLLSTHIKLPKMRNFKEPHPSILVLQVLCELPKFFKTKSLSLYRASRSTDWLSTP